MHLRGRLCPPSLFGIKLSIGILAKSGEIASEEVLKKRFFDSTAYPQLEYLDVFQRVNLANWEFRSSS
jgi:hypothetical protein